MQLQDSLNNFLAGLKANTPVYVAYSGGLDSHVLLHLLSQSDARETHPLHSIHVNHNLMADSGDWARHCEATAESLGFYHQTLTIDESPDDGASIEAWAREKRYQLLTEAVEKTGTLLTAHHQEDQAETLLLQLFRGSGISGLAAMPEFAARHQISHARPLLGCSKEELLSYAKEQGLQWVEDVSNSDIMFDRNYLRHEVLPPLRHRWPGVDKTISRAASHQASALQLLEEVAAQDLVSIEGQLANSIDVQSLKRLTYERQSNVLRYWIKSQGYPLPSSQHIKNIVDELVNARIDSMPLVTWPGCEIRRHDNHVFVMAPLPVHDNTRRVDWDLLEECEVISGKLIASKGIGTGIKQEHIEDGKIQVRYRQGGETIQLPGKGHAKELKKLFQEFHVPTWLRDRIPLLYSKGKLVAVADIWLDYGFAAHDEEECWKICWHPAPADASLLNNISES